MYEFSDEGYAEPEEVLSLKVPFWVEQGRTELVLSPDPLLGSHIIDQEASLTTECKHELVYHDKVDVESDAEETTEEVWAWF